MPTPPRAPSFQLEQIHTRVVYDAGWEVGSGNNPAPIPDSTAPGGYREPTGYAALVECIFSHSRAMFDPSGPGLVQQWCDLPLARAWIADLRRYVVSDGPSTFTDVTIALPFGGSLPHATDGTKGLAFLNGVQQRLVAIYNALNIPWCSHPAARRLYRKWMAGAPGGDDTVWPDGCGSSGGTNVYNVNVDYNDHWFSALDPQPIDMRHGVSPAPDDSLCGTSLPCAIVRQQGIIPSAARMTFLSRYSSGFGSAQGHATRFLQEFGLMLMPLNPGEGPVQAVEFINTPFACVDFDGNMCPLGGARFDESDPTGGPAVLYNTGATPQAQAQVLWSDVMWTTEKIGLGGSLLDLRASARAYLDWFMEWIDAVTSSSPEQIIIDATRYAWFANQRIVDAYGSPASAFNAMVRTEDRVPLEEHLTDSGVTAAAQAMGAVGAVAMTAGPYGAAVGLALMAGAAVIKIWDVARTHPLNPTLLKRDDIGRFKPALEHPWLAGRGPGYSASNGPPNKTLFMVPEPDGFVRGGAASTLPVHVQATLSRYFAPHINVPAIGGSAPSGPNTTSNPLADLSGVGSRRWVKPALIAGSVVAAAGVAFGAYRYATRSKR